jgi:hypothetical protein
MSGRARPEFKRWRFGPEVNLDRPLPFCGVGGLEGSVPITPAEVPKFLVLEPGGGVRLDVELPTPSCEVEVALENEVPGRNFVLMIGHPSEHFVQRVRIAGRAKLYFDPGEPGLFVFLLTNPMHEPAVVRMRVRPIPVPTATPPARTVARARVSARRVRAPSRRSRSLYTRGA